MNRALVQECGEEFARLAASVLGSRWRRSGSQGGDDRPHARLESPRGARGRFAGEQRRVNVESILRLPAWTARLLLEDPRGLPYAVAWQREGDRLLYGLRMERRHDGSGIVLRSPGGHVTGTRIAWRPMPGGRGRTLLLICPTCARPKFYLYPILRVGDALSWGQVLTCAPCGGFLYASQGAYRSEFHRIVSFVLNRDTGTTTPWAQRSYDPFPRAPLDPVLVTADPRRSPAWVVNQPGRTGARAQPAPARGEAISARATAASSSPVRTATPVKSSDAVATSSRAAVPS